MTVYFLFLKPRHHQEEKIVLEPSCCYFFVVCLFVCFSYANLQSVPETKAVGET